MVRDFTKLPSIRFCQEGKTRPAENQAASSGAFIRPDVASVADEQEIHLGQVFLQIGKALFDLLAAFAFEHHREAAALPEGPVERALRDERAQQGIANRLQPGRWERAADVGEFAHEVKVVRPGRCL
jgi:hypothetical protein